MEEVDLSRLVSRNQSIKIVPSTEDCLRNLGLNVDLDNNVKIWFEQLRETWKIWKKSAAFETRIEMFFQSVPDPYRVALVFVIKCEGFKDCKPKSFPYFIIETLQKWSQTNGVFVEETLKLPAFHIAVLQKNQHFLTLMVKTYQLCTIKESVLPIIKDMIRNDNCKQVCQIVIAMELFDDIPVEDLLFPLILQDKTNMIDEYLSECPNQVKPLLLFLDKLLDKNYSMHEFVQKFIEENRVCNVKYSKLHCRPLGKLVARLCNKFKVPIETCKNLSKNRTTGGLRYLIHQKYQEHNVSSSVWDDLVKDSLKQSAGSALEFIDMLLDYDKQEAHKWAVYLNIPQSDLPLALRDIIPAEAESIETENWETESLIQKFYEFSLPDNQIIMIDTAEKFYDMIISNLIVCNVVSIDCEWKPSFGATQSKVALIQIATSTFVYLIDTLILNKPQYSSFWYTFNKSFLDNAEIIKLGFGLQQDLKEMKASVIGLGSIKIEGEGLLDLGLLWKALLNSGLILPSNSDNGGNSLSSLVQSCFGLPLEKSEQCSNWELRPLRSTQVKYAALDAHVLIEIYDFLQKRCQEQGINFEEICNDVMLERKKKCSNKIKVAERLQMSVANVPTKSVDNIKFLVEPNLSIFMSYIRYCGIDTIVMPSSMLWHDVINLAISEDRFILLTKLKCTPNDNFPQSSILDVGKSSIKDQLHKVFSSFNIEVKESDLLSRCINCNKTEIKKLTPNEFTSICNEYQSSTCNKNYAKYISDYEEEEANYDNFLSDSEDEDLCIPIERISVNKSCTTSKGVPIEISNIQNLSLTPKGAFLCESCGKLFWEGDELLKNVCEQVLNVTKLSIW